MKNNKEVGFLAELLVVNYFEAVGYKVAKFGKEGRHSKHVPMGEMGSLKDSLPVLGDSGVGYSSFNLKSLGRGILPFQKVDLNSADLPRVFDYEPQQIVSCAEECMKRSPCYLFSASSRFSPCSKSNELLQDVNSPTFEFMAESIINSGANEDQGLIMRDFANRLSMLDQDVRSFYLQYRCMWRFSSALLNTSFDHLFDGSFIRDNQIISKYMSVAHPRNSYRYDFVIERGGVFSAVEVKANDAELSFGQKMRLGLLQEFGHESLCVRVPLSENDLFHAKRSNLSSIQDPAISDFECDLELPSVEEVRGVVDGAELKGL